MAGIPTCCVTGRVAGDPHACGDCDPCGAAHTVPDAVKRLIAERDEWADKYAGAMMELDNGDRAMWSLAIKSTLGNVYHVERLAEDGVVARCDSRIMLMGSSKTESPQDGYLCIRCKRLTEIRAPGTDPKTGEYSTAQMMLDEMTMGDTSKPLFD